MVDYSTHSERGLWGDLEFHAQQAYIRPDLREKSAKNVKAILAELDRRKRKVTLRKRIDAKLDDLFTEEAHRRNLPSGDITPMQNARVKEAVDILVSVFCAWIDHNSADES